MQAQCTGKHCFFTGKNRGLIDVKILYGTGRRDGIKLKAGSGIRKTYNLYGRARGKFRLDVLVSSFSHIPIDPNFQGRLRARSNGTKDKKESSNV